MTPDHQDLPDATLTLDDLLQLRPAPKPCHNYVCAYPLPPAAKDTTDKPDDDGPKMLQMGPLVIPIGGTGSLSGMRKAIVISIGPLAGELAKDDQTAIIQYQPGDTIYYSPQAAVTIDGYDYLQVAQYVAWDPGPDHQQPTPDVNA